MSLEVQIEESNSFSEFCESVGLYPSLLEAHRQYRDGQWSSKLRREFEMKYLITNMYLSVVIEKWIVIMELKSK